jgi:MoaD family protein
MKLKIKFLKPFSDAVDKGELELDFNGITLGELLKVLLDRYPKLKTEFYTKTNELSENMCIFVNDKPTSALNGIKTKLKNGDELIFFIPISGG